MCIWVLKHLLHALIDNNYMKYDKFHLWDFVKEQRFMDSRFC